MRRHPVLPALLAVTAALLLGSAPGFAAAPAQHHAASATTASGTDPGSFHPLAPARMLDTRIGTGGHTGAIAARGTVSFPVTSRLGVPATAEVGAVVLNLTATEVQRAGYFTAWPNGSPQPGTSDLNVRADETRSHAVVVRPGPDGRVALYNGTSGTVQFVVDVAGWFAAAPAPNTAQAGQYTPLPGPVRLLDTRTGTGASKKHWVAGTHSFAVAGRAGIPMTGVSYAVVNLTATDSTATGHLDLGNGAAIVSFGAPSSVNFAPGGATSNLVVAPVGADGAVQVTVSGDPGVTLDVVADVDGWIRSGGPSAAGRVGAVTPYRLLDTRTNHTPIPARGTITVQIAGKAGVPLGAGAAALNLTVSRPAAHGYLVAYPSGTARPIGSSVNFGTSTVPNALIVALGSDGAVRITNSSAAPENVVVDLAAYVGRLTGPLTWSGHGTQPAFSPLGDFRVYPAVSCVSAAFCVAVGGTQAEYWNGSSWSDPQTVFADPVQDVACVSPTFCAASGSDAVDTFDGVAWHPTPEPHLDFPSVSCASATLCLAGGSSGNTAHPLHWNGSTWAATDIGQGEQHASLLRVACAAPSFCLVDQFVGPSGFISAYDGVAWRHFGDQGVELVACASSTFCIGSQGRTARSFNGASWAPFVTVVPSSTTASDSIDSLTCSTATRCTAVASTGAAFWNGAAWSSPVAVDPNELVRDISCPTAEFCMVLDDDGYVTGTS